MKLTTLLIFLLYITATAQKIKYTISNGLQIDGVDATNPVIYDNDMVNDTPDIFYLWLKANRKEVNLVGNINTKDMHPAVYSKPHDNTFNTWMKFYNAYTANGMKNVPSPVKGSAFYFTPGSFENSPGSDLIIAEAKKASAVKPLIILVGGQVTSIANAFAKDRSIGPNIIVMHVDGYGETGYNCIDDKAALELINGGVRYINWSGNLYSWYNKAGSPMYSGSNKMPGINLNGMPSNSFSNELRNNWFNQSFAYWGDIGDAPPIFYFFNHYLWQNVVRKNIQKQTITTDNFAYLLVSENKWNDYGPMLNSYVTNPQSYIPVTTIPPVNIPPSVSILTSNTTYPAGSSIIITATASDDKAVSKVEFFNGSTKLGESIDAPYSWVISNAAAGTYNLTGKATDNEGASTVSAARVVTVTGIVVPPDPAGEKVFDITKAPFYARGDGVYNDGPAIQAAIDAATKASGKVVIPAPNNFYRTNQTIFIQPKSPESQAYISIEGNGKYFSQIVYTGPSNSSAVVIVGLKGGSSIKGLHVTLADNVTNTAVFDIGTNNPSGSTSGFSIDNCTAQLGQGINNVGFRQGLIDSNYGSDISQIDWKNVTAWAPFKIIPGQVGFHFAGGNSLGFTINTSSTVFCETGIKVTAGGVITLLGYLSSQNGTELYMSHSTQVAFFGGRFESGKKFLRVDQSANFPGVTISGALISDFKPADGKLFDFQAPGGLTMDNVKIESSYDYDSRMFSLGNNGGTLSIRGGAMNANDNFVTGGWRTKVENVVKLNSNYQSVGYFTNR